MFLTPFILKSFSGPLSLTLPLIVIFIPSGFCSSSSGGQPWFTILHDSAVPTANPLVQYVFCLRGILVDIISNWGPQVSSGELFVQPWEPQPASLLALFKLIDNVRGPTKVWKLPSIQPLLVNSYLESSMPSL